MLSCKISLSELDDEKLKCGTSHKCDRKSKLRYLFEKDLFNSDDLVIELMNYVEDNAIYKCKKTEVDKNPNISVYKASGCKELICRIAAKFLERQAFMKAKERLGLYAKEDLVVDESKLQSYFKCKEMDRMNEKDIPIYIV